MYTCAHVVKGVLHAQISPRRSMLWGLSEVWVCAKSKQHMGDWGASALIEVLLLVSGWVVWTTWWLNVWVGGQCLLGVC